MMSDFGFSMFSVTVERSMMSYHKKTIINNYEKYSAFSILAYGTFLIGFGAGDNNA
jgi:hypothetical protein